MLRGNLKDFDLFSLLTSLTIPFCRVRVELPSSQSLELLLSNGRIVRAYKNGERLKNLVELVGAVLPIFKKEGGEFFVEKLASVEEQEGSADLSYLVIIASTVFDEISHNTYTFSPSKEFEVNPKKEHVSDPLIEDFLNNIGKKRFSLEDALAEFKADRTFLQHLISSMLDAGVISEVESFSVPEGFTCNVALDSKDEAERERIAQHLRELGFGVVFVERSGEIPEGVDVVVVDVGKRGFLWLNSTYGSSADKVIVIGGSTVSVGKGIYKRFKFLSKPVSPEALGDAIYGVVKVKEKNPL